MNPPPNPKPQTLNPQPLQVKRCFYCTLATDTLHSIAAKFQTSWMQVWAANHDRLDRTMVLVGAIPWRETKNPNELKPGTLLRLGPVFRARVKTSVVCLVCVAGHTMTTVELFVYDLSQGMARQPSPQELQGGLGGRSPAVRFRDDKYTIRDKHRLRD